jgi:hypothetical protein
LSDEDSTKTEYQYSFYLDGKFFHGLELDSTDVFVDEMGRQKWIFMLNLWHDKILASIFKFKQIINNDDDELLFLQELARGLVGVFEKDARNDYDMHYLALTDAAVLTHRGITVPDNIDRLSTGKIVLAETFIYARTNGSNGA